MELLLLLSTLVLSTLILFLSLKLLYSKRSNASRLPPGRMGWPFFGETLEFLSTGRKGVPEKFFHDRMSRYSPEIFKTSLLAEKMVVLCGAAGNKFLFTNEAKLVTSWLPRNVKKLFPSTMAPGEDPVKTRRFLAGFLKPDALQKYVGTMDAIAKEQLDAYWDSEEAIAVFSLAKRFTVAVACRLLLSIDDPDHVARLEKPVHSLLVGGYSLPINFPGTNFNRAMRASGLVRREVMEIIKARKRDQIVVHRDVLDHMLTATDEDGRFRSGPDIADKIMGLIIGDQDATSALITFIVKYLAELPHIYDNVLKEQREIAAAASGELLGWDDLQKMKYSWNVVCEVMRLAPPVQGNFCEAITDFTYAGFSIPKGWKLYWNANMTHKNPEYFEEPEKFDPSRFEGKGPIPYSYVPFGGGSRMCPAQEYARIEILVFMHNLVRKFKWGKCFLMRR